jgi:hypothetical protein
MHLIDLGTYFYGFIIRGPFSFFLMHVSHLVEELEGLQLGD